MVMTVPGSALGLPRTPAARPSAPAAVTPAAAKALTTASAAVAEQVDSASLLAPSVDGAAPASSSELSLEDITDTETTVEVSGSSPAERPVREDEIDDDRAYFAPRIVPKAALPTDAEAAKVVINLPGETMSEEITQAIGKSALDQRVLAQRAALARRREPTVRIPRKDVQSVRAEIAAAERAGRAQTTTEPDILVQSDSSSIATATAVARPSGRAQLEELDRNLEPAVGASRSGSSKLTVVTLVVVALGALAAGTFYFRQIIPPSAGTLDAAGEKTSAPVAATQPATTKEPEAPTASTSTTNASRRRTR